MSQKFIDSLKREWFIEVNLGIQDRVYRATKIDISKFFEGETATKLENDVSLRIEVMYEIIRPQAEPKHIDYHGFMDGMKSEDQVIEFMDCLHEALINFTQSHLRPARRELKKKMEAFRVAMLKKATENLKTMNPQKMASKAMAAMEEKETGSEKPGNSPVGSD